MCQSVVVFYAHSSAKFDELWRVNELFGWLVLGSPTFKLVPGKDGGDWRLPCFMARTCLHEGNIIDLGFAAWFILSATRNSRRFDDLESRNGKGYGGIVAMRFWKVHPVFFCATIREIVDALSTSSRPELLYSIPYLFHLANIAQDFYLCSILRVSWCKDIWCSPRISRLTYRPSE